MPHTVVVQYVPDAVVNERINVGVIILHDGRARSLFLENWARVKHFASANVSFLKDIQRESQSWDEATVRRLAEQWTGSVQFTQPRFTLLPPGEALIDSARRYLSDRTSPEQKYRRKTNAVRIVRSRVKEKLTERLGALGRALMKDSSYELKGEHLAYEFDVSVGNGVPYFAAQGLSFEVPVNRRLEKEVSSTAWLINDVLRRTPDLPIGVAVLSPRLESGREWDNFQDASAMFEALGARVVKERDVSEWAEEMIDALPQEILRPRG